MVSGSGDPLDQILAIAQCLAIGNGVQKLLTMIENSD